LRLLPADGVAIAVLRLSMNLRLDPPVRLLEALVQTAARGPAECASDKAIIRTASAHSQWTRYMPLRQLLAGNSHHHVGELIDGDHLL